MSDMSAAIDMLRRQMESEEKVAISARHTAVDKRAQAAKMTAEAEQMEQAMGLIRTKLGERPNKDGTRSGPIFMCEQAAKAKRAQAAAAINEADTSARSAEAHEAKVADFAAAILAIGGTIEKQS